MALVSVIIPYYKKINRISQTLDSVLKQTFQDFEIILVYDDTDNEDLEFIEKHFNNNSKIKIIKNIKNFGAGISRNIGIKNSSGSIIAFIDADDIWYSDKLEKQINFMRENNYDFTFTNYVKKISNQKKIQIQSKYDKILYKDLLFDNEIGLSTVMLNKKIVKGELFPAIKTKEDYVLWLQLSKRKIGLFGFKRNLVSWRKLNKQLSGSTFQKLKDAFIVYNKYLKFNFLKSLVFTIILSSNFLIKRYL